MIVSDNVQFMILYLFSKHSDIRQLYLVGINSSIGKSKTFVSCQNEYWAIISDFVKSFYFTKIKIMMLKTAD